MLCGVCVCVCIQEVAELKEEDLPSSTGVTTDPPIVTTAELPTHANAATELLIVPAPKGLIKLPTPASGVSGDLSKTLGKTDSNEGKIPILLTIYSSNSQVLMTCVMCWLRFISLTTGRSLDYSSAFSYPHWTG